MSIALLVAALAGTATWLLLPGGEARLARVLPRPAGVGRWQEYRRRLGRLLGQLRVVSAAADPEVAGQLPLCLDLLAACLDAGASTRDALEAVHDACGAATREILAPVAGQLRLGRPDVDAWRILLDDPAWGPVAREVIRSATSGTALVLALRAHASQERRAEAWRQRRWARAVGARAVLPLGLCFLPAFVLVGIVPIVAGLLKGILG